MRYIMILSWAVIAFFTSTRSVQACYGGAPLGMGGAFVAQAEGTMAIYWNPAGLGFSGERGDFSITQTSPLQTINYSRFLGFSLTNDEVGWGFATTELADWHPMKRWLQFSMGFRVDEKNAVGVTYRQEEQRNGRSSISWDWGWQYRSGPFSAGLLVQDASEDWVNLRPGVAYHLQKATIALSLYDMGNRNGEFGAMVGVEFRPWEFMALRIGDYLGNTTLGMGFTWRNVKMDWSFLSDGLGDAHHVTVGIQF